MHRINPVKFPNVMSSATSLSLLLAFLSRVHSDVVLTQPEVETVRPGGSLNLICKTSGFTLSSTWMYLVRQVPGKGLDWLLAYYGGSSKYFAQGVASRFTPSKDNSNEIFAVNVVNLRIEDTAVYYCAREGNYTGWELDYWGGGTTVTVTAASPTAPILYPLISCEQPDPVDSVTFGCMAMDYSTVGINISWRKDEVPIKTGLNIYPAFLTNKGTYTRSSQLTITEAEAGSSAIYCVVRHHDTTNEVKMPDRVVHHPTVTFAVNSLEEIKRSRKVIVVCLIANFRPQQLTVTWLRNAQLMNSGVITSPAFEVNGNFSATSQLTLAATEWFGGSVYTCQVTHREYTQSRNISMSPGSNGCEAEQITIQPPPLEQVLLDATATLTCIISHAPYGVNVSWSQGKDHLKSEITVQIGEDRDSVISNLNISTQDWLSGNEFYCIVSHADMPTPKRASIRKEAVLHPREPSVSVLLPPTEDVSTQRTVVLTCLVRGFYPRRIFVKWTIDDKSVDSGNYRNTEVKAENGNSSFFMYSLLSVGTDQWASGASFTCVVGHESLPMKTIARMVNRSSDFADSVWVEDYEDDRDTIWTTASTFIILFFLSISYGAALTLVKVK